MVSWNRVRPSMNDENDPIFIICTIYIVVIYSSKELQVVQGSFHQQ